MQGRTGIREKPEMLNVGWSKIFVLHLDLIFIVNILSLLLFTNRHFFAANTRLSFHFRLWGKKT